MDISSIEMDDELREAAVDILMDPQFLKLDGISHHGNSILDHSLKVTNLTWKLAGRWNLDRVSAARGALLHDFFLYDWKVRGTGVPRKRYQFWKLHGFTHPSEALRNAEDRFHLNPIERNIILRHMFPLTPIPPRYPESWVVTLSDKIVSSREIPLYLGYLMRKFRPRVTPETD